MTQRLLFNSRIIYSPVQQSGTSSDLLLVLEHIYTYHRRDEPRNSHSEFIHSMSLERQGISSKAALKPRAQGSVKRVLSTDRLKNKKVFN